MRSDRIFELSSGGKNMKKFITLVVAPIFFCLSFHVPAIADEGIKMDDLVEREGLYYEKFSTKPFTGTTVGLDQYTFRNGLEHGKFHSFYNNGNLFQVGEYNNGKATGELKTYFPTGKLLARSTFKNGKKNGASTGFNKDGNLLYEGLYWDDKMQGEWRFYQRDGRLDFTGEECPPSTKPDCVGSGIYSNGKKVGNLD